MTYLHYWDYKYLCKLEQKKIMTKLYLEEEIKEIEETPYWTTETSYGNDIEIIYHIKK